VLAAHPRGGEVAARLVELDPRNTAVAADLVAGPGLSSVDFGTGDASRTDAYDGVVPADLVLLCGLFGNITDDDILATIAAAAGSPAPAGR
jgi:hypothetical protein